MYIFARSNGKKISKREKSRENNLSRMISFNSVKARSCLGDHVLNFEDPYGLQR